MIDGKLVVASSGSLQWYELSGKALSAPREVHTALITRIAVSTEAGMVAASSWDAHASIWNAARREPVERFRLSLTSLSGVDLSADGRRLLTTGDGNLKLVDVAMRARLLALDALTPPPTRRIGCKLQ